MSGVYIGGDRVGSSPYYSLRHYNLSGTQQQTGDLGSTVRCLATDVSGNVYVGGSTSAVKKYNTSLTQDWSRSTGNSANYAIAVDTDGNYYVAGNGGVRKYNSAGTQQWAQDPGGILQALAVDASGNVYVGGVSQTLTAYDSSGTFRWSASHGNFINGLACDASGNVYLVGNRAPTTLYSLRKYNSAGSLQWSAANHGSTLYAVTIGDDGAIYVGGNRSSSITTRKYTAGGTLTWSRDYSYSAQPVYSLTVDADHNVYVVSEYRTLAYNSAGTSLWSNNHGGTLYAAAVWRDPPAPIVTDIPALGLGLSLAIPTLEVSHTVPGWALALALATPSVSSPPLPPDTPGDPQMIYRGYVSGGDPLEIPLISIQCRRRRGDSTWVSVQTGFTALRWAALKARQAASAELVIDAGYRAMDGSESVGLFLRATLTAVDQERTGMAAMITLTGRVIPVAYTHVSRPLYGVTRRGKEAGKRTAQCAVVDPLLRPGDTVDDGAAEWEAGAILYRIDPATTSMTVTED